MLLRVSCHIIWPAGPGHFFGNFASGSLLGDKLRGSSRIRLVDKGLLYDLAPAHKLSRRSTGFFHLARIPAVPIVTNPAISDQEQLTFLPK